MIFQNVNINGMNMAGNQEFMKICSAHPKCEGCPLKDKVAQQQGVLIRCETGRAKKEATI